jgi:hypothetical protein
VPHVLQLYGDEWASKVDPGLMTFPDLFEYCLDRVLGAGRFKESKTVEATERDEVKSFRPLEPLQAVWHGVIVVELPRIRSSR